MQRAISRAWMVGVLAGAVVLTGWAGRLRADDGRLVIASGAPEARQVLVLDPMHPGNSQKLGKGEAYLPDGADQGLLSDDGKVQSVRLSTGARADFASSNKMANAGQAVRTASGKLFVISQGNRRVIEFDGATGKFVAEHFLAGVDGVAWMARGLAVVDGGVVALAADPAGKEPVKVYMLADGEKGNWKEQEVAWPDKKPAMVCGQACAVSGAVVAVVDTATLRVIELDFSGKQVVRAKTVATLAYKEAAGATGLAYDPARQVYYVGSVGKDMVYPIMRSTGAADKRVAAINVTDPTFLCFLPAATPEPVKKPVKK